MVFLFGDFPRRLENFVQIALPPCGIAAVITFMHCGVVDYGFNPLPDPSGGFGLGCPQWVQYRLHISKRYFARQLLSNCRERMLFQRIGPLLDVLRIFEANSLCFDQGEFQRQIEKSP